MKIHGDWEITLLGNVLVRSIAGHFNVEGTKAFIEEVRQKAPKNQAWAVLGNAENWEMSGKDSLKLLPQFHEWSIKNGCVCFAIVMPTKMHELIHQRIAGEISEEILKYCSTLEEACAWLNVKGFAITPQDYPHYDFLNKTKISS